MTSVIEKFDEKENYYEVLGVENKADTTQISKAFKKKAREYHPDLNDGEHAKEMFDRIGKAYRILSDESLRNEYDKAIRGRLLFEEKMKQKSVETQNLKRDLLRREEQASKRRKLNQQRNTENDIQKKAQELRESGYDELYLLKQRKMKEKLEKLNQMNQKFDIKLRWKKSGDKSVKIDSDTLYLVFETLFGKANIINIDKSPKSKSAIISVKNKDTFNLILNYKFKSSDIDQQLLEYLKSKSENSKPIEEYSKLVSSIQSIIFNSSFSVKSLKE